MGAKESLIFDVNGGMSVSEAADEHGIARSCAYKWVTRYRKYGLEGLQEQSRRPERSPDRTSQEIVDELLALKRKHPGFGPAKLATLMEEEHGEHVLAASTAGTILARYGQVKKRRSRESSAGSIEHSPYEISGAGDTGTTDFKGQFRMGNGALCYPLTIADPFSRYIMAIEALESTHMARTKEVFEKVFRKYGLPRQLVSDNGIPFCSRKSLGGLTQLSRWWIEMGIIPVRIQPGRPDQNGIHERMHRTLKEWIVRNPKWCLRSQQRTFNEFRTEFNHVRPHESLGQKKPVSAFRPYRPYPRRPPKIEYDTNMDVRSVNSNGEVKWKGNHIFCSEVLIGAKVGLLQVAESLWSIHFGAVRIGYLDELRQRAVNRRPQDEDEESKAGYGR
jgi:transposase InsO family protein